MDFCDWRINKRYLPIGWKPGLALPEMAKQVSIKIDDVLKDDIRVRFSWQKVQNQNNVEENTLEDNLIIWKLLEDIFKGVTFEYKPSELCTEWESKNPDETLALKDVLRPYSTEWSKNMFFINLTNSSALEILKCIKTTTWNSRFRRGDTSYLQDENEMPKVKEDKNGSKISFWTKNVQLSIYVKNLELSTRRDSESNRVLKKLEQAQLTVIRLEVRIKTVAKLKQIMKYVCKKEKWDIYDLLNPETEKQIVQHFFLPILEQVPTSLKDASITQYLESGLKAGFSLSDMEHVIGHLITQKAYPDGAYRDIVVNKELSPKQHLQRSAAWQYNQTKVAKILDNVPFIEVTEWTAQKEEMLKQLTEFKPFKFNVDIDIDSILPDEEELQQLADEYFSNLQKQREEMESLANF